MAILSESAPVVKRSAKVLDARRRPGHAGAAAPTRTGWGLGEGKAVQEQPSDHLSSEKLQLFVAGLSGLPPDEVRKAKSLYIRNAIAEYRALQESYQGFRGAQGCLSVIPVFWPIVGAQRRMMDAQLRLSRERIRNAIEVWKDDLRGERFDLGD
jgi:hypothetical protein